MTEEDPVRRFVSTAALNRMADMPQMRAYRAGARGVLPAAAYVDNHPVFDPTNPEVKAFIARKGARLRK